MTAANGETAFHAIKHNLFDLCFLDVHLPDISGLDIMKKLRIVSPGTRIVIMTGSEVTDGMMKSIEENAHLLIAKPLELEQVKTFVDKILTTGRPLYQDEYGALRDDASFIKWLASDNRKHERRFIARNISYFAIPPEGEKSIDVLSACVIDISESGMCIRTNNPIQPGHVLRLFDTPAECTGIVRWSKNAGTAESYWAGIQFLSPEHLSHDLMFPGSLLS